MGENENNKVIEISYKDAESYISMIIDVDYMYNWSYEIFIRRKEFHEEHYIKSIGKVHDEYIVNFDKENRKIVDFNGGNCIWKIPLVGPVNADVPYKITLTWMQNERELVKPVVYDGTMKKDSVLKVIQGNAFFDKEA